LVQKIGPVNGSFLHEPLDELERFLCLKQFESF